MNPSFFSVLLVQFFKDYLQFENLIIFQENSVIQRSQSLFKKNRLRQYKQGLVIVIFYLWVIGKADFFTNRQADGVLKENYFLNKIASKKEVLAKITKLMGLSDLVATTIGNNVILNTTPTNIKRQPMTINNLVAFVIPPSFYFPSVLSNIQLERTQRIFNLNDLSDIFISPPCGLWQFFYYNYSPLLTIYSIKSMMRQEYPHSLSYQPKTLTI